MFSAGTRRQEGLRNLRKGERASGRVGGGGSLCRQAGIFDREGAPETVFLKGKGACMSGDMHGVWSASGKAGSFMK